MDGKTTRRSFDTSKGLAAIHMVLAWACDQKLAPGQRKVDEKYNEIKAIPELLELLEIKGAIVTIDAMGCQRKICQKIDDKEADYVIGLKGNQGKLLKDVDRFFDEHQKRNIGGVLSRISKQLTLITGGLKRAVIRSARKLIGSRIAITGRAWSPSS